MNFRVKIFTAMAFVLAFGFTTLPQAYALEFEDGCEDVLSHPGADINFLRAAFLENEEGPDDDELQVELELCGDGPLPGVKYRLRLAYDDSDVADVPAEISEGDVCDVSYNKGMMYRDGRDFGPGSVTPAGNSLIFSVYVDDLKPGLEYGDTIYIKADTQYRGILDRVPGKNKELDGCGMHFLEFDLEPDVPDAVCPCFNADLLSQWGDLYMPTELDINRDPVDIFYSAVVGFAEVVITDEFYQCRITDPSMSLGIMPPFNEKTANFANDQERDACIGLFLTEFPIPPSPAPE